MPEVIFAKSLIFHGFPNRAAAELFVDHVGAEFGRECAVYDDPDAASDAAIFPYVLDAPCVLVARDKDWTLEREIEHAVGRFGGKFAGT